MGTHLRSPRNWEDLHEEIEQLKAAADNLRSHKDDKKSDMTNQGPALIEPAVGLNIDLLQTLNISDGSTRTSIQHPKPN